MPWICCLRTDIRSEQKGNTRIEGVESQGKLLAERSKGGKKEQEERSSAPARRPAECCAPSEGGSQHCYYACFFKQFFADRVAYVFFLIVQLDDECK